MVWLDLVLGMEHGGGHGIWMWMSMGMGVGLATGVGRAMRMDAPSPPHPRRKLPVADPASSKEAKVVQNTVCQAANSERSEGDLSCRLHGEYHGGNKNIWKPHFPVGYRYGYR